MQPVSAPSRPDDLWEAPALQEALNARHIGQVIRAYRYEHRPVLTQTKVGRWLGLSQAQVSRLERAEEPCHDLNKLDEWARGLRIPQRYLWFQLSEKPHDKQPYRGDAQRLDDEPRTGDEDMRRRQVLLKALRAGAASVGGSAFAWFSAPSSSPSTTRRAVGMTDIQIVREMTQTFRSLG